MSHTECLYVTGFLPDEFAFLSLQVPLIRVCPVDGHLFSLFYPAILLIAPWGETAFVYTLPLEPQFACRAEWGKGLQPWLSASRFHPLNKSWSSCFLGSFPYFLQNFLLCRICLLLAVPLVWASLVAFIIFILCHLYFNKGYSIVSLKIAIFYFPLFLLFSIIFAVFSWCREGGRAVEISLPSTKDDKLTELNNKRVKCSLDIYQCLLICSNGRIWKYNTVLGK